MMWIFIFVGLVIGYNIGLLVATGIFFYHYNKSKFSKEAFDEH